MNIITNNGIAAYQTPVYCKHQTRRQPHIVTIVLAPDRIFDTIVGSMDICIRYTISSVILHRTIMPQIDHNRRYKSIAYTSYCNMEPPYDI